jgi:tetratricopeptide (TPR) repeat protein
MRFQIYLAAKRWEMAVEVARCVKNMLPDDLWGYFHLAFALHELKRTQEAYDVVKAVVDKFPDNYLMRYNLACYSCCLGNRKEAMSWLERAIDLAGDEDVRQMALDDEDLEQLWAKIGEV